MYDSVTSVLISTSSKQACTRQIDCKIQNSDGITSSYRPSSLDLYPPWRYWPRFHSAWNLRRVHFVRPEFGVYETSHDFGCLSPCRLGATEARLYNFPIRVQSSVKCEGSPCVTNGGVSGGGRCLDDIAIQRRARKETGRPSNEERPSTNAGWFTHRHHPPPPTTVPQTREPCPASRFAQTCLLANHLTPLLASPFSA